MLKGNADMSRETKRYWNSVNNAKRSMIGLAKSLYMAKGEHFVVIYLASDDQRTRTRRNGWNVIPETLTDVYAERDQVGYSTREITQKEINGMLARTERSSYHAKRKWRKK